METINSRESALLLRCHHLIAPAILAELAKYPNINPASIEATLTERLNEQPQSPEYVKGLAEYRESLSSEAREEADRVQRGPKYLRGVPPYLQGIADALIALLPSSYSAVNRIFSMTAPTAIFEVHFTMFSLLEKGAVNPLEQDGIEYMLEKYLMNVRSTEAYAAWKAGLVLAEEWLSADSERLLAELIANARFPAGRLGAINGYSWLIGHRKSFSRAEFAPLNKAARDDSSDRVRSQAKFHLRLLRKERQAAKLI